MVRHSLLRRTALAGDGLPFALELQDHYLDTEAPFSRWGPELNNRIKGDAVLDGTVFDLPALYDRLQTHGLSGVFCDRNNPCWFQLRGRRYIALNGRNFIVRTTLVRDPRMFELCESLRRVCDSSYP